MVNGPSLTVNILCSRAAFTDVSSDEGQHASSSSASNRDANCQAILATNQAGASHTATSSR
jgi:hypothetical protein